MIVLETMYVMSNLICHFITCKLISCFVYPFLDPVINIFFGKKVSDVEIPSKSLNTFFWVLMFIKFSWRNVTRRGMVYKHFKPIVFVWSALDFFCIVMKSSASRFKFSRSRKNVNNKETQTWIKSLQRDIGNKYCFHLSC